MHRAGTPGSICTVRVTGAIAATGVVLLAACSDGRREASISDAQVGDDDRTLILSVGACNADDNRAEVVESEREIVVTVTTDDGVGGDDCADGVTVTLTRPLAGRQIVDGSTGESVAVLP